MKTATIDQLGNQALESKITQDELLRRLVQLEKERDQYKLDSQNKIRRSEAKYLAMLESVDAHMTLVDKNLQILWANRKAKKMFGRDIVGKSCCEALYGKKEMCGSHTSSCLTRQAFNSRCLIKCHSIKLKVKDGAIKYFEGTAKVVSRDNDGKPSVIVKIYKDVTERKQAEEQLRQNMMQMRKNLDTTIKAIARTVETKDAYTAGHQRRTTEIARAVAF